jgi:hypothetical protein
MISSNPPAPGSDRVFGGFFAVLLGGAGAYALWHGHAVGWLLAGLAAVLALLAAFAPGTLHGANRAWFAFGMLLARIVNPIVLGALFFLGVTPLALLMRVLGKRPLRLAFEPAARTYWIEREPRGPAPASMREQF